jgi:hypothetical protein
MGHIHESHGVSIHHWTRDASGRFIRPSAQNDATGDSSDAQSSTGESTVFVNAANQPHGPNAWRVLKKGVDGDKFRVPFGGPGFQPVVVDLKD